MKLHGLTPVVSLISSAESAEAHTRLRSSSYGGSVRRIHPRAYAQGLLRRRITTERCAAPRPYGRGTSPHASSGGTLRSVPSFAKATEGTHLAFIHGFTPVAFCEGG